MLGSIKTCGEADFVGKSLYASLGAGRPKDELNDSLLVQSLSSDQLETVCKDASGRGYYLSPAVAEELKLKINPSQGELKSPAGLDDDLAAQLAWLEQNPPETLSQGEVPNPNEYLITSLALYPIEVALLRYAIGDSMDASASLLKRIPNAVHGKTPGSDPSRYAVSVKVDATQYDKIFFHLSQLTIGEDVAPKTKIRVRLLKNEINDLRVSHLNKRAPEKPLIIPDSYFGAANEVAPARSAITAMESATPPSAEGVDLDDYTLFREPLFLSDIAFLRWKMEDADNSLFVNYNGALTPGSGTATAFYVKRDIDWDRLIAALAVLESTCRTARLDDGLCNRVGSLVREAERVDRKIKEEDDLYQAKKTLIHSGIPFALGGAAVAAVAKGPALIKWIVSKIGQGGPKGPPPSPPTNGGRPLLFNHRGQPMQRTNINWEQGGKTLLWGLATLGAGALTVVAGAGTVAAAACPVDGPAGGILLGAGTVKSAGLTAAAASAFYLSGSQFIRSFFE